MHSIPHYPLSVRWGNECVDGQVQHVMNAAARVVSNTHKFDRGLINIHRNDLHWPDVPECITFRVCIIVMVYKCLTSSSRMRVTNHNWSAMKQRLHLQSVAEISRHPVLSGDRIRQCETSSGSRHKDTDQCPPSLVTLCSHKSGRCTVELYHASHLWYPPFYTSPMASSALQH